MGKEKILVKCVMLGPETSGKTSLMNRFIFNRFSYAYQKTVGADFHPKEIQVENRGINLQIWDTAGQERFRSLNTAFMRGADVVLLTIDATSENLDNQFKELEKIYLDNIVPSLEYLKDCKFLLVANKAENLDAEKQSEIKLKFTQLVKNVEIKEDNLDTNVYFTKAKDDYDNGVDQLFLTAAEMVLANSNEIEEQNNASPQNLNIQAKCLSGIDNACSIMIKVDPQFGSNDKNFKDYIIQFKQSLEQLHTQYQGDPTKLAEIQSISNQAEALVVAIYGDDGKKKISTRQPKDILDKAKSLHDALHKNFPDSHSYVKKIAGALVLATVLIVATTLTGGLALPLVGLPVLAGFGIGLATGAFTVGAISLSTRSLFAKARATDANINKLHGDIRSHVDSVQKFANELTPKPR